MRLQLKFEHDWEKCIVDIVVHVKCKKTCRLIPEELSKHSQGSLKQSLLKNISLHRFDWNKNGIRKHLFDRHTINRFGLKRSDQTQQLFLHIN